MPKSHADGQDKTFSDIDLHQLHLEWLEQPKLRRKYGRLVADAKLDLNEASSALEEVRAELANKVRRDPASFGCDKATVDGVRDCVTLQKEYKAALQNVHTVEHRLDYLKAALAAIDDRKKALENLVQLWLADYYAEPKYKGGEPDRDKVRLMQRNSSFNKKRRVEPSD